jgi:hypothetical protein
VRGFVAANRIQINHTKMPRPLRQSAQDARFNAVAGLL